MTIVGLVPHSDSEAELLRHVDCALYISTDILPSILSTNPGKV